MYKKISSSYSESAKLLTKFDCGKALLGQWPVLKSTVSLNLAAWWWINVLKKSVPYAEWQCTHRHIRLLVPQGSSWDTISPSVCFCSQDTPGTCPISHSQPLLLTNQTEPAITIVSCLYWTDVCWTTTVERSLWIVDENL